MATERTVLVRLKANVSDFQRAMLGARAAVKGVTDEIDHTNDRTAWLAQSVLGLGPAFVPLAAGAVPVISGLATQMTVAAAAAGTAALAFNGVGDGLKALNDYQLHPTGENMAKLGEAMDKIGPSGEHLVRFLDEVGPKFSQLGMTAREGMFPGVEEGITHFVTLLPQVNRIVSELATGMGELAAASGEALAGPRFAAFFDYMEETAKPTLLDMGRAIGGFAEGLANMMVQFGPLSQGFSRGFADMGESFAKWSRGLDSNQSFQDFLAYVQEVGPMVRDFLSSLATAFVALLRAAAPVGEILLPAFTHFLDIIAAIASTPLGTAFVALGAAIGLIGRSMALMSVTSGGVLSKVTALSIANARTAASFTGLGTAMRTYAVNAMTAGAASQRMSASSTLAATRMRAQAGAMAGTAAQVGALALVASGAADSLGLTNTAMGALIGSMFAPGVGTAIGALAGGLLDIKAAGSGVVDVFHQMEQASAQSNVDQLTDQIASAEKKLKDLKETSGVGDFFGDFFEDAGSRISGENPLGPLTSALERDIDRAKLKLEDAKAVLAGTKFILPDGSVKGFDELTSATDQANAALRQYMASFDLFQGRLSKQQGLIAFRNGLRELGQVVKDNPLGKGLDASKQGDQVRAALLGPIQQVQQLAKGMKGLEHVQFMKTARAQILQRAAELNLPIGKVQRLLDNLGILDRTDARPKVEQQGAEKAQARIGAMRAEIAKLRSKMVKMDEKGAAAARARIAALRAAIAALRDRTIHINVERHGGDVAPGTGGKVRINAGGGPIRALYPGETKGPRDDTIPARLSHGEWVHNAAAARFYGERFMDDVNNMRLPRPKGYRDGGAVGGGSPRVSVAAPNVSTGDTFVRVIVDGKELRAVIDTRLDERADVSGSYLRASRNADD